MNVCATPPMHCIELRVFDTPQALAIAFARAVAARLRSALAMRGQAALAVSGGSTPELFLRELARQPLAWSRVTITLVDERWWPPAHPRSNEGALRAALYGQPAAAACVVPLYVATPTPEAAVPVIEARIAALPTFDAVVLGMGTDGHTASFFADGDHLREALDPTSRAVVSSMRAASADEPRMTLTLPRLLDTRALYLHIEGERKQQVLQQALAGDGDGENYPIRAVLTQAAAPVITYWCP